MVTQLEKGYYNRETQQFIPMSEMQPRTGLEWAKFWGVMEQPQEPEPTSLEIEGLGRPIEVAQDTFAKARQTFDAVGTALSRHRKDAQPGGPIILSRSEPFQLKQEAEDAEAVQREAELTREWQAAWEELGLAQRAVNALLRQRDGLVQLARREAKEKERQQRLAEEQEAQARAKPGLWKRLGIKA